jgi:hypothetical protein
LQGRKGEKDIKRETEASRPSSPDVSFPSSAFLAFAPNLQALRSPPITSQLVMFVTTASTTLAALGALFSLQPSQALTLHARQSDGGSGLTSPGAVGFDYPPIRGWSLDAGKKPVCGGFDLHARTDFPNSTSISFMQWVVT